MKFRPLHDPGSIRAWFKGWFRLRSLGIADAIPCLAETFAGTQPLTVLASGRI